MLSPDSTFEYISLLTWDASLDPYGQAEDPQPYGLNS